ncbi:DUF4020 domain-containing protein [Ferroacidibacillus organovorans]|uniref:DUF4020 domain-containing protein n=1 Tax=Ferroacidibacillus organovorans TaxID=1765683 RepID=A0A853K9W1_9BACL|nr:DUF4020 domain-containing protein [Ferroacidibacillus organovorans]KYP80801.1 hypothetical protein AYJ22_09675 [Ferroacidibacillus organovorans]OAG93198.1 hypothetical protein AYW79_11880 [Ferroacidibacillus organovorans]
MRVTNEVEIPERLIHALLSGRLVIFAGAGVSMACPTCFPSFKGLVQRVLEMSGSSQQITDEPLDRFLGRLKEAGAPTHQIVRNVIGDPSSQPNDLHRNLLRLFRDAESCRIVTTNFDQHFSTSAQVLFPDETLTYYAPALPVGSNFKGIVYLHGSAVRDHASLVLDDHDFGSAYLTEGWARRFITDVFLHYDVLFVGYSHDDVIMQYLARGLPPSTQRYALAPMGEEAKWHYLGIEPLFYPLGDHHNHSALSHCLEAWAGFMNNGYLETKVFVERVMAFDSPPTDPATVDMLLWHMNEAGVLQLILERASTMSWITWFDSNSVLDSIFESTHKWGDLSTAIANWLGQRATSADSSKVLALIQRKGGQIDQTLWSILVWHFSYMTEDDVLIEPHILASWVHFLISTAPVGKRSAQLVGLFQSSSIRHDGRTCIALFDYLTQPSSVLIPSFNEERDYGIEPSLHSESYQLHDAWQNVIQPSLTENVIQIRMLIARNIEAVHMMLRSTGQANDSFDPVSYTRRSIRPSERQEFGHDFDVLIDAACDVIEHLAANDEVQGRSLINEWIACSSPLLKRLSIYALQSAAFVGVDEKLSFLCNPSLLSSPMLCHDVFELLNACYGAAKKSVRSRFLRTALEAMQRGNIEEVVLYNVCSILHFSAQLLPNDEPTLRAYRRSLKIYPDFRPSEYQNVSAVSAIQTFSQGWGIPIDELLKMSPDEVIKLVEHDSFGFFTETIGRAVKQDFEITWSWAEHLRQSNEWGHPLWKEILFGWSRIELSSDQWGSVLTLIQSHERIDLIADGVANLLMDGLKGSQNTILGIHLSRIEEVTFRILEQTRQSSDSSVDLTLSEHSWYLFALSHAAGKAAGILIEILGYFAKHRLEDWETLMERYLSMFLNLLQGDTQADIAGRVIVAHEMGFLFSIDEQWAKEHVVPRFSWANTDEDLPQQMWHGYLAAGQWSLALIPILLPYYEQGFTLLSQDDSNIVRRQFFNHMAALALFWPGDGHPEWADRFLGEVGEDGRVHWSEQIGWIIGSMSPETKSKLWNRWLRDYWNQRCQGLPRPVSVRESKAMIHWVCEFGDVPELYLESIELIRRCPSPGVNQTRLIYEIKSKNLISIAPSETFELIAYALEGTSYPCYHCADITVLLQQAINDYDVSAQTINNLKAQLIRLGCNQPSGL